MDWAEELKMSIRKTTARKGRRSKSRDVLKENGQSGGTSSSVTSSTLKKEISIDITLDMPTTSTATPPSLIGTPPTSSGTVIDSETKRPPIRRISGGWADTSLLKNSKSKKGSFDDERFQISEPRSPSSPTEDDIPVVPDMDDVKEEILMNEIAEPPSMTLNRVDALKELNSELLLQNSFTSIENVDLSILTHCLEDPETLDEPDEVWEWDTVFTELMAEIYSEERKESQARGGTEKKIEIGPDEIPPEIHP